MNFFEKEAEILKKFPLEFQKRSQYHKKIKTNQLFG